MKRIISLLIALLMVVSAIFAVPFTAYAKDAQASQISAVSGDFEYTVLSDGTAQITDYFGFKKEVIIPSVIDGYTVTSIGTRAFYYEPWPAPAAVGIAQTGVLRCVEITQVTIPDTVTSIKSSAFVYCKNLVGVIIPDSVKSIEFSAFAHCDSLSYLFIGSSLQSIGTNAFSSCKSLETIVVNPNNKVYDSRDNCNAIIETSTNSLVVGCENTVIPESVTSIGDYAFYYRDLDRVQIPSSVTSIGEYAFAYNKNLYSASISDCVKSINKGAFSNCENLKYFTIGNSVESIGDYAFSNCQNLSYLIIGNSVKSIDDYAFLGCANLVEITIPKTVTSIGERAFGYVFDDKNLKYVVIDGFTIYGYNNTEAQRYANDNEIKFVSLGDVPADELIIGDVDGDERVTIIDATFIQRHLAQLETIDEDRLTCADTDKDGEISIVDATMIERFLAQVIPSL